MQKNLKTFVTKLKKLWQAQKKHFNNRQFGNAWDLFDPFQIYIFSSNQLIQMADQLPGFCVDGAQVSNVKILIKDTTARSLSRSCLYLNLFSLSHSFLVPLRLMNMFDMLQSKITKTKIRLTLCYQLLRTGTVCSFLHHSKSSLQLKILNILILM